jgi:hypothetical protein
MVPPQGLKIYVSCNKDTAKATRVQRGLKAGAEELQHLPCP